MSVVYSTGARNKRAGMQAIAHAHMLKNTIAFVDGGSGVADSITDSGNGFVSAGFRAGDLLFVKTVAGTNDKASGVIITSVAAGTIVVPTAMFTNESATPYVSLVAAKGGSLKDLFDYCTIHLYGGPRPKIADDAETGTLLAKITAEGATFTGGALAAGLRWEPSADVALGILEKLSTENWKTLACLAGGTAVWGRCYDNAYVTGASSSAIRFDFSIGVSGADMIGGNTLLTISAPTGINTASIEAK